MTLKYLLDLGMEKYIVSNSRIAGLKIVAMSAEHSKVFSAAGTNTKRGNVLNDFVIQIGNLFRSNTHIHPSRCKETHSDASSQAELLDSSFWHQLIPQYSPLSIAKELLFHSWPEQVLKQWLYKALNIPFHYPAMPAPIAKILL